MGDQCTAEARSFVFLDSVITSNSEIRNSSGLGVGRCIGKMGVIWLGKEFDAIEHDIYLSYKIDLMMHF